jgi:hypothetical protein
MPRLSTRQTKRVSELERRVQLLIGTSGSPNGGRVCRRHEPGDSAIWWALLAIFAALLVGDPHADASQCC